MATSAPDLDSAVNHSTNSSNMLSLKLEKAKTKSRLTRLINNLQMSDQVDQRQRLGEALSDCRSDMSDLLIQETTKLAEAGDNTTMDTVLKEMDEVDTRVSHAIDKYVSAPSLRTRSEPIVNTQIQSRVQSSRCLKPVELPTWDAKSSYLEFINLFDSLVSDDDTATVKMIRLKNCLRGPPLALIERITASESGYRSARSLLDSQYGGISREIRRRIQEAHQWPSVMQGNSSQFLSYYHFVQSLVSSLESVAPEELGDGSLYEIVIAELPVSRRAAFLGWVLDHGNASIISLNEWLNREARIVAELAPLVPVLEGTRVAPTHFSNKQPRFQGQGHISHNHNRGHTNTFHTAPATCSYCSDTHDISNCKAYLQISVDKKWQFVKSIHVCFTCLKPGHRADSCRSNLKCTVTGCVSNHHTTLHKVRTNSDSSRTYYCSDNVGSSQQTESLSLRTLPVWAMANGRRLLVNAVLDDGSNETFVSQRIANHLGLHKTSRLIDVHTLNGGVTTIRSSDVTVKLASVSSDSVTQISARTCPGPVLGDYRVLDWSTLKSSFKHLTDIEFDPPAKSSSVDILIGINHPNLHQSLKDIANPSITGPIARLTPLGWTCVGPVSNPIIRANTIRINAMSDCWEIEPPTQEALKFKVMKPDERIVLEKTKASIIKQDDRYQISVPWTADPTSLPNNLKTAEKRLNSTLRRLSTNATLKAEYNKIIQQYEDDGIIKPVPTVTDPSVNYMPHHPVVRDDKSSTKVRIVFDGSCKTNGVSLNGIIHPGPNLQPHIVDILTRFRLHTYALTCDISKMFLQISLQPSDRKYFRFLWVNELSQIQAYEFQRVPFGQTAAPFQAMLVARHNAELHADEYPRAAETITQSTYMDDCLDSVESEAELRQLHSDLEALWSEASMKTHKWASNHPTLFSQTEESPTQILPPDDDQTTKMLGVVWKSGSDVLSVSLNLPELKTETVLTKRDVWRYTASLYDPLGMISPLVVTARIIAQSVSIDVPNWDDPLPKDLNELFCEWMRSLVGVTQFSIPRHLNYTLESQLLIFCDASRSAYGAVAYLRTKSTSGVTTVRLIMSKAKVTPKTPLSIPCAELTAAVLGIRLAQCCLRTVKVEVGQVLYFSDSTDVLWWIQGRGSKYKPYVEHRIGEIQLNSSISQWFHVKSEDNPADLCSRGCSVETLKESIWVEGPEWLKDCQENWPVTDATELDSYQPPELRKSIRIHATQLDSSVITEIIEKHNDYQKIVRVLASCLKFAANCAKKSEFRSTDVSAEHLRSAELLIVRHVQTECYPEELKLLRNGKSLSPKHKLASLKVFIDSDGTMRVGGRLQYARCLPYDAIHPFVLPATHMLTTKLVRSEHENHGHRLGTNQILCLINRRCWIPSGRCAIRAVLNQCVRCQRLFKSPPDPPMAPLRETRTEIQRVFYHTGVDLAGPFEVNVTGRRAHEKRWIVLFTCHTFRAVNLQVVYRSDKESFIGAYRRFVARFNHPSTCTSDRGGNFVAAASPISRAVSPGLKWHFNPPAAPHFGGIHESLVKSLKRAIQATVSNTVLSDPELLTLLAEIEADMNNRPLTYRSEDPEDPLPLTPNHFIMGAQFIPPAPDTRHDLGSKWKHVSELVQQNWRRFIDGFLPSLQKTPNTSSHCEIIVPGDIVIVLTPDSPRGSWPLGIVVDTFPGRDGVTRVANVRLGITRTILKRPVVKLVKISI